MTPLTKRQKEVFDVISGFIEKRGYSPSYEEIAKAIKVSSLATVSNLLRALKTKHFIDYGRNKNRSICILPASVRGLQSCINGHARIYFYPHDGQCPCCALLAARATDAPETARLEPPR